MTLSKLNLAEVSYQQFAEYLSQNFRACLTDAQVDLELIQVEPWGQATQGSRQPFALTFRGDSSRVLPQQIHRLQHGAMGSLEVFLVPIGPDGQGMRYEAVFS